MEPLSKNVSVDRDTDSSEADITAELPASEMSKYYDEALNEAQKEAEVDGFRKGNAPRDVVESNVGQGALMQKAAEKAIQDEYPRLLEAHKISPLGQPQVTITKIAPGSDLGFRVKTAVMPSVELGDYKKAAREALKNNPLPESPEITDKEIEDVVYNLRASRALEDKKQKGEEVPAPESLTEEDLPELTDEFVASLGEFSDLDDFYTKIREHLKRQKTNQEQDKQWAAIVDAVIAEASIPVPQVLIDSELDKMMAQLKDDITRAGLSFEDYCTKVGKSEEDIRSEWTDNAKKRAQTQLALNAIASQESIHPDPEAVEQQAQHLMEHYGDADPERVRVFVETQLTNEKTLSFLTSLDAKEEKGGKKSTKPNTEEKRDKDEEEEK